MLYDPQAEMSKVLKNMGKHTSLPYERRGTMVYTEDTGIPGQSKLIAECATVKDADFIINACNSYYLP